MPRDNVFLQFQWQDRKGVVWNVEFDEDPGSLFGHIESRQVRGKGSVYVQTHDFDDQKQPIARLIHVKVSDSIENRGLGSMLVRKVVEECKRRGHKGIDGYLSEVDRGHFQKLQYFYENLGFSVVFYDLGHHDYRRDRAGKIEMVFDN